MRRAAVCLSPVIAALSLVAGAGGLLWRDGSGPYAFTTLRGETVRTYGEGLYRYDSLLSGSGHAGQDVVVCFLAVPLLAVSVFLCLRGSLRGGMLLVGVLAYFLHYSASMSFGAAYNDLFLVYVALFSASLFAFVAAFSSFDAELLRSRVSARLPRFGIAAFLFALGAVLLFVWGGLSVLPALLRGEAPPELAGYTTLVTHALDLGVMAPASILAGVSLLRRAPMGYLLAATMLVFSWLMGTTVAASTVAQALAGYPYAIGQVAPFVVLALVGFRLTLAFFRCVGDAGAEAS